MNLADVSPLPRLPPPARRRSLRERHGITQQALASEMAVTIRTISRWENGTAAPTGDRLRQYSELLTAWAAGK